MSQRIRFHLIMGSGVALLVFGLLCLNYTRGGGAERHHEFAARYGLPAPSQGIQYGGLVAVVVGSGAVGYGIGRWRGSAT
jgi:hypothetical protein